MDPRAIERVSGPAWEPIRPLVEAIHKSLIAVSPTAQGSLTTIYVKYTADETGDQPFAVLWIKKSSEIVLGLSLPAGATCEGSLEIPPANYQGITTYFRFIASDRLPDSLAEWINAAYQNQARQ